MSSYTPWGPARNRVRRVLRTAVTGGVLALAAVGAARLFGKSKAR